MQGKRQASAVSDSSDPRAAETDPNGARTAVGVPHPENRPEGQSIPAVDLSGFELDDYDDDKQQEPTAVNLPPDQDVGESFTEIIDVGETPEQHHHRGPHPDNDPRTRLLQPTVDNQVNQPDRFHNREPKAETSTDAEVA